MITHRELLSETRATPSANATPPARSSTLSVHAARRAASRIMP
jgi:hypothetical protein